jgi:hypothetical protein
MKFLLSLLLTALLVLSQAGCSPSQIVTSAKIAVSAADVAISSLEANHTLSVTDANDALNYLAIASSSLSQVSAELQTSDSAVVKSAKIGSYLTTAILQAKQLKASNPVAYAVIAAVDAALLSVANSLGVDLNAKTANAINRLTIATVPRLSGADKRALNEIKYKADAVAARAIELKAKLAN